MMTHVPVMCDEILDIFAPVLSTPGAIMVDATLGLGGHSLAALDRFDSITVVGIDRDPQAIETAAARLRPYEGRFEIHQATYDEISTVLDGRKADAILFDLGLSSLQIDSTPRGFAYSADAPLNMRMDADESELTAQDVVNTYSEEDLARIFRIYGEEKYAGRIARAIVDARKSEPFSTSARLVEVIVSAVPQGQTRGHPAKRVFQAIRMEVNDERTLLERALPKALESLNLNGRMAVLSYHSGEDRIVKHVFAQAQSDHVPHGIPVVPDQFQARFSLVVRGALKPSDDEMMSNPRSQSARLRVIERTKEDR